jgi:serine/threonine protein kinase
MGCCSSSAKDASKSKEAEGGSRSGEAPAQADKQKTAVADVPKVTAPLLPAKLEPPFKKVDEDTPKEPTSVSPAPEEPLPKKCESDIEDEGNLVPVPSHTTAKDAVALVAEFVKGVQPQLLMESFVMFMDDDSLMGEGSFSVCRKGVDIKSGEVVAIKTFRTDTGKDDNHELQLQKFIKQVKILENFLTPLEEPDDDTLWCDELADLKPEELFVKLIDYSRADDGEPGADLADGIFYLVTELASYSLDDYLYDQSEIGRKLSKRAVQELSRAILLVTAALHVKNLCHLDLKPENLMLFNSRMKLIDVDGCRPIDSKVYLGDASVSFSPAFCAPEWARWMTDETEETWINVHPLLDSWSIGMTICQLITLEVVFEEKYGEFTGDNARTDFLTWLSKLKEPPFPKEVAEFDPELGELVTLLLECKPEKRMTCASCMLTSFVQSSSGSDNRVVLEDAEEHQEMSFEGALSMKLPEGNKKFNSTRLRELIGEPILKSCLWQLIPKGSPEKTTHWQRCDMWLTKNGDLCLYDMKDRKPVVCVENEELAQASVLELIACIRGSGFEIKTKRCVISLAFDNTKQRKEWAQVLRAMIAGKQPPIPDKVGPPSSPCLRVECRNRRAVVPSSARRDYEPVFRTVLWKCKQGADRKQRGTWHAREMWISINLHLVYYSVKEDRDLIYYNKDDLSRARILRVKQGQAALPWAFQIIIPPDENGVSFQPGLFAAISEQARERWIQEFHVQQAWQQTWQDGGCDSMPMTRVKTEAVREMFFGEGEDRFAEYAQKGMLHDRLEKGGWKDAAKEKRVAAKQNALDDKAPRPKRASVKAKAKVKAQGGDGMKSRQSQRSQDMKKRMSVRASGPNDTGKSEPKLRKGVSKMITTKDKPQGKVNNQKKQVAPPSPH